MVSYADGRKSKKLPQPILYEAHGRGDHVASVAGQRCVAICILPAGRSAWRKVWKCWERANSVVYAPAIPDTWGRVQPMELAAAAAHYRSIQ